VYRHDQVEPKRKVHLRGPELVSLLAAVWTINRTAKRYRELASSQYRGRRHGLARHARGKKEMLYAYKGQALHYLVADGTLQHVGYHRFPGDNWAEVLTGGGFTFHRPCPTPKQASAEARTMIEAKPREIGEPRLTDAIHTVDEYLKGKDPVEIYEWPPRERFRSSFSPEQEDDEAAEAWDPDPE